MKLTLDEVRVVAELAQLALTPQELERFTTELGDIITAVEVVAQVDAVPENGSRQSTDNLREDRVGDMLSPKEALANAPAREGTYFAVPKVIS